MLFLLFFFKGFFILCFGMLLDSKVGVFIFLFISYPRHLTFPFGSEALIHIEKARLWVLL